MKVILLITTMFVGFHVCMTDDASAAAAAAAATDPVIVLTIGGNKLREFDEGTRACDVMAKIHADKLTGPDGNIVPPDQILPSGRYHAIFSPPYTKDLIDMVAKKQVVISRPNEDERDKVVIQYKGAKYVLAFEQELECDPIGLIKNGNDLSYLENLESREYFNIEKHETFARILLAIIFAEDNKPNVDKRKFQDFLHLLNLVKYPEELLFMHAAFVPDVDIHKSFLSFMNKHSAIDTEENNRGEQLLGALDKAMKTTVMGPTFDVAQVLGRDFLEIHNIPDGILGDDAREIVAEKLPDILAERARQAIENGTLEPKYAFTEGDRREIRRWWHYCFLGEPPEADSEQDSDSEQFQINWD